MYGWAFAGQQQRQRPLVPVFRPLCDGVFRAVSPNIANAMDYCGKVLQQVTFPCLMLHRCLVKP